MTDSETEEWTTSADMTEIEDLILIEDMNLKDMSLKDHMKAGIIMQEGTQIEEIFMTEEIKREEMSMTGIDLEEKTEQEMTRTVTDLSEDHLTASHLSTEVTEDLSMADVIDEILNS